MNFPLNLACFHMQVGCAYECECVCVCVSYLSSQAELSDSVCDHVVGMVLKQRVSAQGPSAWSVLFKLV